MSPPLLERLPEIVRWMRTRGLQAVDWSENGEHLALTLMPPVAREGLARAAATGEAVPGSATPVLSPEMGLFRHAETAADAGVAAGDILGFIEIGPVRLAVLAPCAGGLGAPCHADGAVVGYHAVLFEITPRPR